MHRIVHEASMIEKALHAGKMEELMHLQNLAPSGKCPQEQLGRA